MPRTAYGNNAYRFAAIGDDCRPVERSYQANKQITLFTWAQNGDYETLDSCMREIGFTECIKQTFGKSLVDSAGKLDVDSRAFESLYIDAIK